MAITIITITVNDMHGAAAVCHSRRTRCRSPRRGGNAEGIILPSLIHYVIRITRAHTLRLMALYYGTHLDRVRQNFSSPRVTSYSGIFFSLKTVCNVRFYILFRIRTRRARRYRSNKVCSASETANVSGARKTIFK